MAQEVNFVGEGRFLITNKASLIGTIGVEDEPSVKLLQVASCDQVRALVTMDVPQILSNGAGLPSPQHMAWIFLVCPVPNLIGM